MTPTQQSNPQTCKHCGGEIQARNPTGQCDHLYWPDMLTDEAKLANGYKQVIREVVEWERNLDERNQ